MNSPDATFTPKQNYCAYLNISAIPQSILGKLKLNAPTLSHQLEEEFNPEHCYIKLYKEIIFTIIKTSEITIDQVKAEFKKELISLEARHNFIKHFQEKKEYALLIKDAKSHSKPEDELKIKQEIQKLEQFYASIEHLIPEKITT